MEALILDIKLSQTKPIVLINVYRPPSGKVNEGIGMLQDIIDQLPPHAELFIAGDLNIDISKSNTPSLQTIRTFEHVNNLVQLITGSTRTTNRSSTLIDHIYTNSDIIQNSGTLNINISDHLPIFTVRKKPKLAAKLVSFTCRKLKYFDADFYKQKLLELDWTELYNSGDPEVGWCLLIGNIRKTLDSHYPLTDYKNVPAKAAWITSELFEQMFQRDNKFKEAKLTKNPDIWDEAKKLRNQVADNCKKAKKSIY